MIEWQPIETAPKDRAILVWDGEHIDLVAWEIINIDRTIGTWSVQARGTNAEWGEYGDPEPRVESPTHWISLPEPPK